MDTHVKETSIIDLAACERWLGFQTQFISCATRACLFITGAPEKSQASAPTYLFWPEKDDNAAHFSRVLQRAHKEQKGFILSFQEQDSRQLEASDNVHIAFPLSTANQFFVAALEIEVNSKEQLHKAMQQLETGMEWLKAELQVPKESGTNILSAQEYSSSFAALLQKRTLPEAATLVVNQFVSYLQCSRVSLGLQKYKKLTVLAISGQSKLDAASPLVAAIGKAMQECLDQETTVVFPNSGKEAGPIIFHHQQLTLKHGSKRLISIPLSSSDSGEEFVLTLEHDDTTAAQEENLKVVEAICKSLGPALGNISVNEKSLLHLIKQRLNRQLKRFRGHKITTLLKGALPLVLVSILFFGHGEFKVEADVTLTGTILRTIVAPFPGYVAEADKSAGDHVVQGERLALLDTSDIVLDELSWTSKLAQADLEYRKAIAENATSEAKVISQQKKQAEIQLSLLGLQKTRATITAPFDGLIITGDLSQNIGGPVEKGKMLFEMVPDGGFKVYAHVDEADISFVEEGQQGALVFNSLPKDNFNFIVTKITPIATAKDGKNSFRVEAKLDHTLQRLTPGMTGYAKISVDRKPYFWLWTRKLREKLRLLSWKLTP